MFKKNKMGSSFNVELPNGTRVDDVATKVGKIVGGEKGEAVGKVIDQATKRITIKIDPKEKE